MNKRVGIIGLGKMGMLHGALFNKLPGFELVAAAETSPFILRAFRSFLPQLSYFQSYEDMLASEKLDALIITTPSSTHVPAALSGLSQSLDLFIEKPLSNSFATALTLHEVARKSSSMCMVGYCLRYMPPFQKAREMVRDNVLGKITRVKTEMFISDVLEEHKGWRYNPKASGGGVVADLTVHVIDLLCWFFGRPISVSASTKQLYSKLVEDEASISFSYDTGMSAHIETSWSRPEHRKSYAKMSFFGEYGELVVTDQTLTFRNGEIETRESYAQMYAGYYLDIGGPNYSIQASLFAEAVRTRTAPEADLVAALTVQYLVERIYESASSGKEILLPYGF